ncbi:MAG TPA: NAD(P)/FAD-dependent oxidoreductase [Propionibacteriaceae bacterium]|nr:NAD(P)/FAD-dependent oxidoreductase [Propionibacteriaceae bacterium]
MTDTPDTDVVIAGAGPVGLALSLMLGLAGVRSQLVEPRAHMTPRDESRAITWMPEGLLAADAMGVTDALRARSVVRNYHEFRAGPRQSALVTLDMAHLKHPHPYTLNLPQGDTEQVLESAALATGAVTIHRGCRVASVAESSQGVTATVTDSAGASQWGISARFGVGCDGAASTRHGVAALLGIGSRFRDYGADSVVADVEYAADPAPSNRSWIALEAGRPLGAFCFGDRRWRLVYRMNTGETAEMVTAPHFVADQSTRAFSAATIVRHLWASSFRLGQGQASAYWRGRWSLAGDAAHAMGPSAGAGMQLGVLGAWRLAAELEAALENDTGWPRRAAAYETGQRRAAMAVQRSNARIFRSMAITSRPLSALRAAGLRGAGTVPAVVRRLTAEAALVGLAPTPPGDG